MRVIIVTGTPGTGKTTLSKKLAKKLDFYYLDVAKLILKRKLSEGYDLERKTKIIDTRKLNKELIKGVISNKNKQANGIIIDSHLSHYLPEKYADLCIVTKCDLKKLSRRLKKKEYSERKIRENLDAEIFDICLNEAKEREHKVIVIDTTKGINIRAICSKIGGFIGIKQG